MTDINKAHFDLDGDNLRLTMPIAKIDEEKRIVSGFATLDNVDRQGDILLSEASRKAFENFRGNVRLMHQPIPAGKVVSFRENSFYDQSSGKTYNGIFVDAYISKGAENIWQMVLDGTLTGFSIGGKIVDFDNEVNKEDSEQPVRVVKEYELMELSLVDSPANQFANIFSIQKLGDEIITSGIATEFTTDTVFWCRNDSMAFTNKADDMNCPVCKTNMEEIGWVESNDVNKNQEIGKLVDNYLQKADSVSSGDFVSWGSSGGTARGKVERVVRTGSVDVPDSDFTITAEEGNPAVLIRVYRKGADGWERTDRVVGHKMSTLTRISSLDKMHDEEDEEEEIHKETVTNEVTANKNPSQGNRGGIPSAPRKKKRKYMKEAGEINSGDYVVYTEDNVLVKGRVDVLENTTAAVRVYKEEFNNKFQPTNIIVTKNILDLTKIKVAVKTILKKSLSDDNKEHINNLISQHNDKYDNVSSKKVTFDMLHKVFDRGIAAYESNPGSEHSDVASAEQWALARVNGFLQAVKSGKFKRKPYDIDLLPKGHPLSTKSEKTLIIKKQEGGVEVADNETGHEELDTAQAVNDASEEVEFELEETVEGVVTEALAMAKSDHVEADSAVDAPSEVFDMEKALGEVKSFVEETIQKSIVTNTESLEKFSNAVVELAKAVDEKIGQLQSKYEEVTKSLADLNNAATEIASRVESVEEETAIKKSGELESSLPEQPVVKKSLWGGRFLSSAELFN